MNHFIRSIEYAEEIRKMEGTYNKPFILPGILANVRTHFAQTILTSIADNKPLIVQNTSIARPTPSDEAIDLYVLFINVATLTSC